MLDDLVRRRRGPGPSTTKALGRSPIFRYLKIPQVAILIEADIGGCICNTSTLQGGIAERCNRTRRFSGRGFSPGFSGTRGFSTGRFSGRGDHGRFGDRGFRGRDRDFRDFDGGFFDFGSTGFGYPDDSYYYPYSYYNDNGYLRVERAVQEELAELGYYYGPVDGTIGPETQRAIRWFQSVDKIPITGRIDSSNVVSAADQLRVFFLRLQLRQLSPADVTPDGRRFKKLGKSKTVIWGSRSFTMFSVGF